MVDVSSLHKYGHFTFDPGFNSTASCESKITYIDGDKGILLYRGYPIEQLASKSNFLEVCYLLLNGELPTKAQYDTFCKQLTITRWCMNKFVIFLMDFVVMRILWRSWSVLLVRYLLFIMIH